MSRYRKILVAYDGSSSAKTALALASHIAKANKSWMKVLAVVPDYLGDLELVGVSNIQETIAGPGHKLLEEAKQLAAAAGVSILTNLEQGEPYERIVRVAEEEKCDLIVLGRKGRHPMERELMGAVAARVIGHTPKDVLVVPDGSKVADWQRLMLATDGSKYLESSLAKTVELAKELQAEVALVSVVYSNDEVLALAPEMVHRLVTEAANMLEKVETGIKAQGVTVESIVREGEPHAAITELAAEKGTDLIVMGSHGRTGLSRLLMGSVTERVIGYAPCPVLVSHLDGT